MRQLASDPLLSHYSVIIIDEVHERHIQGDFLLGIQRRVVRTDRVSRADTIVPNMRRSCRAVAISRSC